jgi:MEMO1 family protein
MPLDPAEPLRSGKIIVPGQEHEPEPLPPGGSRIIQEPGAAEPETPPPGGSRIILPPGAHTEEEDLPEYPRLRPLEMVPVREADQELLLVTDPLGVMPAPVALRLETLELLQVLDGTVSLTDLGAEMVRGSQDVRAAGFVRDFVAQLDRMLMLDSPRFAAAWEQRRREYHRLEIRPAALEGVSYPAEPPALEGFLDGHFAAAAQQLAKAGVPQPPANARPRALLVPHLDLRRAGHVIARAWLELGPEQPEPLRVVLFGVGHSLWGDLFALTRKHFETPLGKVTCDTEFVDALAARLGDAAWRSELAHRNEHSIEFQALYLKRRFGDRPLRLVPILCGGFHALLDEGRAPREDAAFEALISAVRDSARALGGATVYVAGVDLSHVGPRFGDARLDDRTRQEVEAQDRAALDAARRGDADGWHQAIADQQDSTRVCGWAATYAMLRVAEPGEGRLLAYEQSEESTGSMVSVAAMVWP